MLLEQLFCVEGDPVLDGIHVNAFRFVFYFFLLFPGLLLVPRLLLQPLQFTYLLRHLLVCFLQILLQLHHSLVLLLRSLLNRLHVFLSRRLELAKSFFTILFLPFQLVSLLLHLLDFLFHGLESTLLLHKRLSKRIFLFLLLSLLVAQLHP